MPVTYGIEGKVKLKICVTWYGISKFGPCANLKADFTSPPQLLPFNFDAFYEPSPSITIIEVDYGLKLIDD